MKPPDFPGPAELYTPGPALELPDGTYVLRRHDDVAFAQLHAGEEFTKTIHSSVKTACC